MFTEERQAKIIDFLKNNTRASVLELSKFLKVSESTIRRDLKDLEDAKLLTRTHGGAISLESVNFEPTFNEKEDKFRKEKKTIVKKAIEFIEEGDTILLDSGTTIHHLVKELKKFTKLTVVTNSLNFAQELQGNQGIDVIIIGGSLRKGTLSLVGPLAEEVLNNIHVDKAFIATNGIDIKEGLTTPNLTEAATKRKMIQSAKQVILLTDHSKIGKITFAKFANVAEIDKCILDDKVSESFLNKLRTAGVDVYTVQI